MSFIGEKGRGGWAAWSLGGETAGGMTKGVCGKVPLGDPHLHDLLMLIKSCAWGNLS